MPGRRALAGLALVAALVALSPRRAEAAGCTIATTSISFGTYNVFAGTPNDSTATITVDCTGGAKNIAIGISRGGSSTFVPRRMVKGSEPLVYNLFRDAARTAVWGDGSPGTEQHVVANPPNKTPLPLTIFGRIPVGQDVSAGAYADTVVVGINY